MMNWTTVSILLGMFIVFYWLRRRGQISANDAQTQLKNGALLVDVRTPAEFNSGHLAHAINIPLDQIESKLPQQVKDKNQTVLLHCQSGMRSGLAMKKLKRLGYANVFNLGSYSRASHIVGAR
jgi:phage shock protein E